MKNEVYAVIDIKSFYASCECAARGLDIFATPLVVADPTRSKNTIVMSVTPYLKEKYRVSNVMRVKDLPPIDGLIFAQPRMAYYIEISAKVVSIFLDFVAEEDLHIYSIDESFLRLTPYLKLYHCDAFGMVEMIQKRIRDELGLVATSGLGPNMFLAKTCLDNEGKKKPPYRAYWGKEDVEKKLWKIRPITKVWGIGHGIGDHLSRLGIRSMEALAKADEALLQKEFGVMGTQLRNLANGIDETDITVKYVPKETNLSIGQTLMKDYDSSGARLVLREMCDDLCFRMRGQGLRCGCVHLFVGYSAQGGFSRQLSLMRHSDDNDEIYDALMRIFEANIEACPIRNLGISFSKLSNDSAHQFSLFAQAEEDMEKESLWETIDEISLRYGRDAVLRASSLCKDSTVKQRHGQIGGHKA